MLRLVGTSNLLGLLEIKTKNKQDMKNKVILVWKSKQKENIINVYSLNKRDDFIKYITTAVK